MKYVSDFIRHFSPAPVFTYKDALRFLRSMGSSEQYAKLFVHKMLRGGRLFRIASGRYSFSRNEAVVGFAYAPFYYGLEYAMSIRKVWIQESNPVIITVTKALPGQRIALGSNITVRRISRRMFFGYDYVKYSGIFVPVASREKILIDLFYYRVRVNGEDLSSLLNGIEAKKLQPYLKRCSPRIKKSVLKVVRSG